jgi:putative transposase
MAKPYSQDLRERVKQAIDDGHTRSDTAAMFRIGIATVERYVARWRQTGSLKPDKFGGHLRHKLADHEATVRALVKAEPDQTLKELRGKLAEAGIKVSKSALDRFLKASGLTYKKNSGRNRTKAPRRGGRSCRVA